MRYSQLFSGSNRGAADVISMSSVRCGNKLADCLEVRLKKQQEPVFYSIEAPKMSSVHFLNMDNMLLSAAATFFSFYRSARSQRIRSRNLRHCDF